MTSSDIPAIVPRLDDAGFRALVEHAADGVALVGEDGTLIYVTASGARILGYDQEELVGQRAQDLVPSDDRAATVDTFAEALRRPGETLAVEHRYLAKDGSTRWIESRFTNLLREPSVAAIVSNFRDVSERKHAEAARQVSEARYRALVAAADDVIYTMDLTGVLLSINPAVEQVTGYRPDELIGRSIAMLVAPDDFVSSRVMLERKLAGQEHTFYELGILAKDGRRLTLEINSRLLFDGPNPVAILGIARDITARKAAQLERARLEQEVLDDLAHDLKNPLTAARGQVQLLLQRLRSGAADLSSITQTVARIDANTQRVARRIDELGDLARLSVGQPLTLIREPTDLVALARHLVETYREITDRHDLTVESGMSSLIGNWDPVRLERVLDNLLANAVKYSPNGGTITVEIRREGEGVDETAVLLVCYHGVGIPSGDVAHVFERYRRGGNIATRVAGRGIGLAGAKHIVEQHGGRIGIESKEGAGTTVVIRLPLANAPGDVQT